MFKLLFGLIKFGLDVWAVLNVWRNTKSDGEKIGWALGIFIFQIVGILTWLAVGPKDQKRLPRFCHPPNASCLATSSRRTTAGRRGGRLKGWGRTRRTAPRWPQV